MQTADTIAELQHAWIKLKRARVPGIEERIRREAGTELALPSVTVLSRLETEGPAQVSELAARAGVDVSTMSRTLRHLFEDGYVERARGEDLRCVRFDITDKGRETVDRLVTASQHILTTMLGAWSDSDRRELARLLTRMAEDLTRHAETPDVHARER